MFSVKLIDILRVMLVVIMMPCTLMAANLENEMLRDPTRPLNYIAQPSETGSFVDALSSGFNTYKLSSVLIRENDQIAVINNSRVRVGDTVGSAIVNEITSTGVLLDINGEISELKLYGGSIKTLVAGEVR